MLAPLLALALAADPAAAKVVLVAGSNHYKPGEHEYVGGCRVLADLLKQTPGVAPVVAVDWPTDEQLAGAKGVVFLFDGAEKHAATKGDHLARVQKWIDAGVGLVQLHQAADYPTDLGGRARAWAGGVWEKGYSKRAHWVATFDTFPDHPICRGVTPFTIDDGWLYRLRFADGMKGVTPLVRTADPKAAGKQTPDETVVGWAFDRPGGGRSFTFTGGHLHASFAKPGYRRFLVNGILWAAGVDVPAGGAAVDLDAAALPGYLPPPAKKP